MATTRMIQSSVVIAAQRRVRRGGRPSPHARRDRRGRGGSPGARARSAPTSARCARSAGRTTSSPRPTSGSSASSRSRCCPRSPATGWWGRRARATATPRPASPGRSTRWTARGTSHPGFRTGASWSPAPIEQGPVVGAISRPGAGRTVEGGARLGRAAAERRAGAAAAGARDRGLDVGGGAGPCVSRPALAGTARADRAGAAHGQPRARPGVDGGGAARRVRVHAATASRGTSGPAR